MVPGFVREWRLREMVTGRDVAVTLVRGYRLRERWWLHYWELVKKTTLDYT